MKAIQFSGGIDSLALLWQLRPQWKDMHVFWCNTGAAYESVQKYMRQVSEMVPHFHEIRSDQPQTIEVYGWPVDVVPVNHTKLGQMCTSVKPHMFQSFMECCNRNIWVPMNNAMHAYGVTDVYRGQRLEEKHRAPIRDGHHENGITYHFPLEKWTRDQVLSYCQTNCPEWIPEYYNHGEHTSRDCWNCTAYRSENITRIESLEEKKRILVERVLTDWRAAVINEMK